MMGERNDRRVVMIHGVAERLGEGHERAGPAGIDGRASDRVDRHSPPPFPENAARAGVRQRGAVEEVPDRAGEAPAHQQAGQKRRRAAGHLAEGRGAPPDVLPPGCHALVERPPDAVEREQVERPLIAAAAHGGERTDGDAIANGLQRGRIPGGQRRDHLARGDKGLGDRGSQFLVEPGPEGRGRQQHEVEQPDVHRIIVRPRRLQRREAFRQAAAGGGLVSGDGRPGGIHGRRLEARRLEPRLRSHPAGEQFGQQPGEAECVEIGGRRLDGRG